MSACCRTPVTCSRSCRAGRSASCPASCPAPVIVHVHGGGWRRGSRRAPLPVLGADFYDALAAAGFAVAAIDYRLSGEAIFPAPLEDVRAAFGWVRDHAAAYGLGAGRVFGWGDSAGGHLALLAALTGTAMRGVVAWFPVTDLVGLLSDVRSEEHTSELQSQFHLVCR